MPSRYIHAKDRLERKLCSQAKRALAIISTSVLKKDDLEMKDFSETCAVCIENYRVADVVRILPCKHQVSFRLEVVKMASEVLMCSRKTRRIHIALD